ncbi:hypothetical protein EDD90_3126 [Streptomyces sp. Ag109_O5-1]|nr:hypothetical protein EDD90_3126 [Streptomyces sp. Ag109_O5-1]
MWSYDRSVSVEGFLSLPFRTLSGRGFAGMVFLLARTADAPDLQRRFFEEWSDIDDLTGHYVGVFSPHPRELQVSLRHPEGAGGSQGSLYVSGVRAIGDRSRIYRSSRQSPCAVRMGTAPDPAARREPEAVGLANEVLAADLPEHQRALTLTVSAMQRFFGIPGALVPCAVIACLEERRVFAVALDEHTHVYDLLKRIMTRIERVVPAVDEQDAELVAQLAARYRHRSTLGRLRDSALSVREEWETHLRRLGDELSTLAARLPEDAGDLSRWLAGRLAQPRPIAGHEWGRVQDLLHALRGSGAPRTLPRRIRRTLARLNGGYPATSCALTRLAAAEAEKEAIEVRIGRAKRQLDELGRDLRLGDSVVGAAQELGLEQAQEPGLLTPRRLDWPLTVLARPQPFEIGRRRERT